MTVSRAVSSSQAEPGPSSPVPPCSGVASLSDEYQRKGFVGPILVLSQEQAAQALKEYEDWAASLPGHKVAGDLRFKPHLHLPFVHKIAHHPNLVEAVKEVLQTSNVLLWSSDFNIKESCSEKHFAPHQDATYAGLEPANQCLTAWVALSDPVHEEQGCLSFWVGSHLAGQLPHIQDDTDASNMLSRGQKVVVSGDASNKPVLLPLHGGEASLHHFYTLHRSGPNLSHKPRIGLALRYCAATVRQTGSVRESVTLVSGHTSHDGFDLEPMLPLKEPISEQDLQKGRDAHAEAMRRESANYFEGANTKAYDEQA